MTQKARPFPSSESYTPTVRQYLNRLSGLEASNDTQFQTITARLGTLESTTTELTQTVGEHEERLGVVGSEIDGALVDILQLQQESDAYAEAIDLLNSRYDTARSDLDSALAAIQTLTTDMDVVSAAVAANTLDLVNVKADVQGLQARDVTTQTAIDTLGTRVTTAEGDIDTAGTGIQALRYADAAHSSLLSATQARVDYVVEAQRQFNGYRLPLSDAILGTVPKVVGGLILMAGDYAALMAYLGCPTTPTYAAILSLVTAADGTELATVAVTGTMVWGTAAAGFTLESATAVDLLLVGNDPAALAIIKGVVLSAGS